MNQPKKNRNGKRGTTWDAIGAQVAMFRKYAGMTQQELADALCIGYEKLASIEQGRRPLQIALAIQIDQLLDTKRALETAVNKVPKREKYPVFVQDFIDYEREALTLLWYENQVPPGLLQSEEYARAVFTCLYPPLDEEELDEWVAGRLDRQKVLERKPPPMATFLMEESVLHRPVGGRHVLRGQLQHLRECADLPFLGLQIMPTNRESHAALDGPMVLLETPDHDHLAYIEGNRVSVLVDDPDEVSVFMQKYGMLRSQALTPEESKRLLETRLGET
ncbi:helix-turn-helix domain-containing protein [Streptomyces boncukensis]|uniref:Helix-turn-helix domain-containing protein n=1 Tax=Streptomyces boncukensis TaxID=2711219 RepID=A0A6G4WYX0_9ACTN|nr:helix-turn-helix transcriptional regulator [Streptomyces boncukensis]NGO69830.1 helix-turn-helix domain-containing protein [Streptomyces boncukensis]